MIEIVVCMILGMVCGTITGLIPGVHVNLISVVLVGISGILSDWFSLMGVSVIIISMAITHSFLDTICGTYLGMPDSDQAIGLLPAHRLLQKGLGHQAVVFTLVGSYLSLLLGLVLFPLFLFGMKWLEPVLKGVIGYILLLVVCYMILKEKGWKKLKSLVVFLVAGLLGWSVLHLEMLEQPMLHMLSGLFGFSLLLVSLCQDSVMPEQRFDKGVMLPRKDLCKAVGGATGIGFVAAFLPGFGSSQAAIIAQQLVGEIREEGFLVLVGGINTANTVISFGTAYMLGKARNGAILAVSKMLDGVVFEVMIVFLVCALIVSSVAVLLGLKLSKIFCKFMTQVDYKKLVLCILGFIILLSLFFDGWLGLFVLFVSTCVGLLASYFEVGKNHLMGCLLVPVILFFI
jgi:putative membrane protein